MTEPDGDAISADELKRRVTIQNEKIKLLSTALNNTAVTLFAGGAVLPIVALSFPLTTAPPPGAITLLTAGGWALAALGIHIIARMILDRMR